MIKITRNLVIVVSVFLVVVVAVLIYLFFGMGAKTNTISNQPKTENTAEKINLTGQVKSSQGVDMAFEMQGKIIANYVKVGDQIYTGQALIAIDSSLLQAQLEQAQAQLDALNINTVKSKTDSSLQTLYTNSLSAVQKSVSTAKDILLTVTDIQSSHFANQTQQNTALQSTKAKAISALLGQPNAELWASQSISQLNGGAFGLVNTAIINPTQDNIDASLLSAQTALQDVFNFVNALPIDPSLTPTERTAISLAKSNINLEIITTSASIQAIASQKINNSATISTTNAQIEAAQSNVNAIKTQISKTVLRALFNGQVDKDNAIVGQTVSPSAPVITISNKNLEIDTYIPEIDLSRVKTGSKADITLDAFGLSKVFPSTVISIDTASTNVNGISVFGAKLKFNSQDNSITPGMTANITFNK